MSWGAAGGVFLGQARHAQAKAEEARSNTMVNAAESRAGEGVSTGPGFKGQRRGAARNGHRGRGAAVEEGGVSVVCVEWAPGVAGVAGWRRRVPCVACWPGVVQHESGTGSLPVLQRWLILAGCKVRSHMVQYMVAGHTTVLIAAPARASAWCSLMHGSSPRRHWHMWACASTSTSTHWSGRVPHYLEQTPFTHHVTPTPPPPSPEPGTCAPSAPSPASHCATMLSKKPSVLLSSYANLPSLCPGASPPPAADASWSCRHRCQPPHSRGACQTRQYAYHVDPPNPNPNHIHNHIHNLDPLHWPDAVKPHSTPTPYQILQCGKRDAYTKHRFYALVKLYHPDQCHPASAVAKLPLHVRLERYRMLVAAHDILSDVEKRKAYDAWGHGWAGHHNTPSQSQQRDWEYDSKRWATDPRNNATWEDWERWHAENNGHPHDSDASRTVQMSNFTFIALVFAFVTIGGVVQGTRFTTFNNSVIERREQIHREASVELRRSQHATMSGDRDERIRTFLEHRMSTIEGEQSYQRLLPPADDCAPDAVRRQ
ncbi:hypothetical protein T440DRAFT_529043 [Plenodomus tracheiphilus IPT5]|uniref:J domain-containing protein n=1 Tax=Plenodomus tracheiphilus IPT5 TaxID=1408161 RepID=A0A6A7BAB2_9PLEO|nr:hypothetical protein T440DRAFT_529043 [Plenodomus tracheiphilus IPT5]